MAGSEFINLRDIPQSPLRAYAQTAVAGAREDQTQGVLADRIATYLAAQFLSTPNVVLANLPAGSEAFYLRLARTSLALMASINGDAPPTPGEIAKYEQRKALALARSRATCHARSNRHQLGQWRRDMARPGTEITACGKCGAGASLSLDRAQEELSEALLSACPGVAR